MKLRSLASLLLLMASFGCGKIGSPMPPLRYVPAATKDLKAEQRGAEVTLTLGYPRTTIGGGALGGLEAIELWQLGQPLTEGEELTTLDPKEFEALAIQVLELRGAELKGSISGDRILVRHRLEASESPTGFTFAVRTVGHTGERSELSNQVTLIPVQAPSPPSTMAVVATAEGVEIHWEGDVDGLEGFHVYRRDAQTRQYSSPLALVEPEKKIYLDRSARFGDRYIYALRSVARVSPLVESSTALERELHYLDRFAPPAPEQFLGLPEDGRVRLRWRASEASDVAGYVLFRADPEADFRRLQDVPLEANEFLDTGLVTGLLYRYRILAVDHEGNEGEPGEIIEARPR